MDRRKLISIENQSPKVRIMTYDDILEAVRNSPYFDSIYLTYQSFQGILLL